MSTVTSPHRVHNTDEGLDREEVTKEDDFTLTEDDEDDEEEEWEGDVEWAVDGDGDEGDVKDESAAYLEFLNEEVGYDNLQSSCRNLANRRTMKAQKFGSVGDDEDDELEEEGLLETPLDKVEPYGLFRDTLMSTPCPPILNLLHPAATAGILADYHAPNRAPTGTAKCLRHPHQNPQLRRAANRTRRDASGGGERSGSSSSSGRGPDKRRLPLTYLFLVWNYELSSFLRCKAPH